MLGAQEYLDPSASLSINKSADDLRTVSGQLG